ncbi:MAG: class I SAM-dependent methyltransferase [Planctomycetota bacterium]
MPHPIQHLFRPLHAAAHWPEPRAYQHRQRGWMIRRVFARLGDAPRRLIVEVGCGDGWAAHELTRHADRVVGFDINPHRMEPPRDGRVLLVAGAAERPPLAERRADLVVSLAVLEHIRDRAAAVRQQARLLRPGGLIVQVVPTAPMKLTQWLGFYPDAVRKELRGLTRSLAGRRTRRAEERGKFYAGRETNNPHRASRRRWWQKLYPRVHGEYDSNWQELRENRDAAWRRAFDDAGFEVLHNVRLGFYSPYFFGGAPLARLLSAAGLATVRGYVLREKTTDETSAPEPSLG